MGPWRHRGAPGWMGTCISGGGRSTRVGGARSRRFLSGCAGGGSGAALRYDVADSSPHGSCDDEENAFREAALAQPLRCLPGCSRDIHFYTIEV